MNSWTHEMASRSRGRLHHRLGSRVEQELVVEQLGTARILAEVVQQVGDERVPATAAERVVDGLRHRAPGVGVVPRPHGVPQGGGRRLVRCRGRCGDHRVGADTEPLDEHKSVPQPPQSPDIGEIRGHQAEVAVDRRDRRRLPSRQGGNLRVHAIRGGARRGGRDQDIDQLIASTGHLRAQRDIGEQAPGNGTRRGRDRLLPQGQVGEQAVAGTVRGHTDYRSSGLSDEPEQSQLTLRQSETARQQQCLAHQQVRAGEDVDGSSREPGQTRRGADRGAVDHQIADLDRHRPGKQLGHIRHRAVGLEAEPVEQSGTQVYRDPTRLGRSRRRQHRGRVVPDPERPGVAGAFDRQPEVVGARHRHPEVAVNADARRARERRCRRSRHRIRSYDRCTGEIGSRDRQPGSRRRLEDFGRSGAAEQRLGELRRSLTRRAGERTGHGRHHESATKRRQHPGHHDRRRRSCADRSPGSPLPRAAPRTWSPGRRRRPGSAS